MAYKAGDKYNGMILNTTQAERLNAQLTRPATPDRGLGFNTPGITPVKVAPQKSVTFGSNLITAINNPSSAQNTPINIAQQQRAVSVKRGADGKFIVTTNDGSFQKMFATLSEAQKALTTLASSGYDTSAAHNEAINLAKGTAEEVINPIVDLLDKMITQTGGDKIPPTQLTDKELAGIAAQVEQRYGPYFTNLLAQSKKEFDNATADINISKTRLAEDYGINLDEAKELSGQKMADISTQEQRAQEDAGTLLKREARNYEESKADTASALQNRGLTFSGIREKKMSDLERQYQDTTGEINRNLGRTTSDLGTARTRQLYNLNSIQNSLGRTQTRGTEDLASRQRNLDIGLAKTQAEQAQQRLSATEAAKNAEINRRLLSYT